MTFEMRKTVSKAQIKQIRFLHQKKFRQRYHQFIVEGTKSVLEFLHSNLECIGLYAVLDVIEQNAAHFSGVEVFECKDKEMEQITALKSHQGVLAVFAMPEPSEINWNTSHILALDDVRDPGNLGTIIRIADWFGFSQIVCSNTCADCFNPKVVQATMGSLSRIDVVYTDLEKMISENKDFVLTLADMDGENLNDFLFSKNLIVIGNEANGISPYLKNKPHQKITIPRKGRAESLNAAISAGIILSRL
jgi:RNA methyltransferase, TrmH family